MTNQTITQGNPLTLFFYVQKSDGTPATAGDFDHLITTVTNLTTDITVGIVNVPNTSITSVVTTDPRYRPSNTSAGYNAEVTVTGDYFEDSDCEYQVEVTFVPVEGESFTRVRRYWCEPSYAPQNDGEVNQ